MIKDKTASLMSTSTKLGAITAYAKDEFKKASFEFGENLGIAFQIKDDLLDILGSSYKTGKDTNADVTSSMITLPMIYILEKKISSNSKSLINKALSKKASKKQIIDLKKIISEEGGINYAENKLNHYTKLAISCLDVMPNNEYKNSLIEIANYNVIRNR